MSPQIPYYLGCPVFASPDWLGKVFTAKAKRSEWLKQYSLAFNTVEGNSTFYGLPSLETAERWGSETEPGFRFALKFPRIISHEKELAGAQVETELFLNVLAALRQRDRLGPSFLQLGPYFDGSRFPLLADYLRALPREFPYAVEVRNLDYFDAGRYERPLDALLTELKIDRVLFDSRPLFAQPPTDDSEREAQRRKPRSPLRRTVTGPHPMLRIVGRNRVDDARPWIEQWAPLVAQWIREGRTPYLFMHTPHDLHAPEMARVFHQQLQHSLPDLPPLPRWPAEEETYQRQRQRELFF
jgi:uncharacterized protein YecE (DUF72 family)